MVSDYSFSMKGIIMKTLRRLKVFLSVNNRRKMMFLEAFILLGWARILKFIPFSRVAPSLGEKNEETLDTFTGNQKVLKEISESIHIMSKYTLWESQCLVKAMAAMIMLERRRIESTLYLGMGRDENGKLVAHAWL